MHFPCGESWVVELQASLDPNRPRRFQTDVIRYDKREIGIDSGTGLTTRRSTAPSLDHHTHMVFFLLFIHDGGEGASPTRDGEEAT